MKKVASVKLAGIKICYSLGDANQKFPRTSNHRIFYTFDFRTFCLRKLDQHHLN